ncbi:MAG: cell division protein FtsW, partial [Frankiales bacterium]|nr:cell division protein FtsW [Frankiales bacterium]
MTGVYDEDFEPPPGLLARPLASYHLLLASTLLLLVLGLVMVFSASSLRSYATTGSLFSTGIKQGTFISLGLPLMFAASRMPVRFYRACAYPLLVVSLALLVAVLFVGKSVNGATSWIPLPMGFNLQPAELAKLALVLWGADLLVRKHKLLDIRMHLLVPLVPVAGLVLLLVMLQPDFGTAVSIGTVVVALLWVVGTPMRIFGTLVGTLVTGGVFLAVTTPHRMERLLSFRDPFADAENTGYQAVQGFYALSSGGFFGLGLGASREKWSGGLPEAHTDYVFAIIGEELGLLGTLTVVGLFAVLIYAGIRIAQNTDDAFVRLASSGVTAWLGCQAIINMGAVVGLLPITGIPLPLVSFGGSALLVTLVAIGMLLSFARLEPGAAAALAAAPTLRGRLR